MKRAQPFAIGSPIVWRSRPNGDIGFVFGCRVLADEPEFVAVVQPPGAAIVRRVAERGGPNGRSLLPGTWDGSRRASTWDRPTAVRLHPAGRSYSVIRTWLDSDARFQGWYVNLEQPWTRTTVGFDSRDDILDVTVSDDLGKCTLKDEDELEFAVVVGLLTRNEGRSIRRTAEAAIDDVMSRRWPFEESAWEAVRPNRQQPPALPIGWNEP